MSASLCGHNTPRPSSAQNVPNDVSIVPTTSCKKLRGIRWIGPFSANPTAPTSMSAAAPPRIDGPELACAGAHRDDDDRDLEPFQGDALESEKCGRRIKSGRFRRSFLRLLSVIPGEAAS